MLLWLIAIILFSPKILAGEEYNKENNNGVAVKIQKPKPKTLFKTLSLPAECYNKSGKNYFALSDGFIDNVPGSKVEFKKGGLILSYDYEIAKSNLENAESDYISAKSSFNRDKNLLNRKVISKEQYENSKVRYLASKSRFKEAEKLAAHKIIYAPFDCKISSAKFQIGEKIKAGDFLLTIYKGDDKFIKFVIPQSYNIDPKSSEVFAIDNDVRYKLSNIDISKHLSEDKLGFYTSAELNDVKNNLIHNSIIQVQINYNMHEGLTVPESSIISNSKGANLFIVDENSNVVKKLNIELGDRSNDNEIEIISSKIDKNSIIVTEGIQKLSDGAKVKIIN